jgi:hypothetical protein
MLKYGHMEKSPVVPPERNFEVHDQHRHETRQQIYLPLILGIVIILAGVVAIIFYGLRADSTLRRWADVSVIWVIIPALFIGLIFMIVVIALLYAVTRLLGVLPGYGGLVQGYFQQVVEKIFQITDALVEPLLRLSSSWAVIKRRNRLFKKQSRWQR